MEFTGAGKVLWTNDNVFVMPKAGDDRVAIVDGIQYFTYEAAKEYAASLGMRLPTKEEADDMLVNHGSYVDTFGFEGTVDNESKKVRYAGTLSQYFLANETGSDIKWTLWKALEGKLHNAGMGITNELAELHMCPLRCVKDLLSTKQ